MHTSSAAVASRLAGRPHRPSEAWQPAASVNGFPTFWQSSQYGVRCHVLSTNDQAQWRAILPAHISVFGSLEYVRLCEKRTGGVGRLFVIETSKPIIAYPFLVRPIRELPFAGVFGEAWDTFTPQYTGPLALGSVDTQELFATCFAAFCADQGIVAEFAHLNPWHVPAHHLDPMCVEENREIVYVDLTLSEQVIWRDSLSADARRHIGQAKQAGVRIRRGVTAEDIDAFHRLHTETMRRRCALPHYYYPPEHFHEVLQSMPDNAFLVLAEFENRLVSGGLFFQDDTEVYWDLSAADLEFARVRPVNLYLYETILAAARQGKKRMLLGGGFQPDDGVFRFKRKYSPLRARFCTYKRIHDAEAYAALACAWSIHHERAHPAPGFFPSYRSTHTPNAVPNGELP